MRSIGDVRPASLLLLVLAGVLFCAPDASAATISVNNASTLNAAIKKARPGDVIQLANANYGHVDITKHNYPGGGLVIRGSRGAVVSDVVFNASSYVTLSGMTLSPAGDTANITVQVGSHDIAIDNILANGVNENLGARVRANESTSDITIQNSEFTQCGRATPCVGLGGTNMLVQNNNFHDCADCDFIHGGGTNIRIIHNTLNNGYHVDCHCHIDLIQVMGGSHWLIAGNSFGYRESGAGQLFISPATRRSVIDDVTVVNNLFWPGTGGTHAMLAAMRVASHSGSALPNHIRIISNTVMTGVTSSINLDDDYARLPLASRPLVSDNVVLTMFPNQCANGQWVDNLFQNGTRCSTGGNDLGNAGLDRSYRPTGGSSLVINRANGNAPSRDANGCARSGAADRGAYEYGGGGCSGSPGLL
jgi:hypothetical protein